MLIQIPKKSGGFRLVLVPSRERKRACRDLLPALTLIAREACDNQVVHGFAELRSPVTNALAHRGFRFTVSFDLADFFDSLTMDKWRWPMKESHRRFFVTHLNVIAHKGIARQGLPTSPVIANILAAPLDKDLKALGHRYTRYADDLSFSFNNPDALPELLRVVPRLVLNRGFKVNPDKTLIQDARRGRRIICGVAVDDDIHPTRAAKRKLRAAKHQASLGVAGAAASAAGLAEWCRLKVPRTGRRTAARAAGLDPVDTIKFFANRPEVTNDSRGQVSTENAG